MSRLLTVSLRTNSLLTNSLEVFRWHLVHLPFRIRCILCGAQCFLLHQKKKKSPLQFTKSEHFSNRKIKEYGFILHRFVFCPCIYSLSLSLPIPRLDFSAAFFPLHPFALCTLECSRLFMHIFYRRCCYLYFLLHK